MKITSLTPRLNTFQVKETIGFYTSILHFECEAYEESWGWASLKKDEVKIMLAKPNSHIPFDRPGFTGSFYFNVDNIDSFWEQVKDAARICYPLENFEYGMREFAIYDNNGYLLQFGQELKNDKI